MSLRGILFALVGLGIVALAANLARVEPSPGDLSAEHAAVPELQGATGCEQCHGADGFRARCTRCHEPIAAQLSTDAGLHGSFAADVRDHCDRCHGEHYGATFALTNLVSWGRRDAHDFRHDHVAFELAGAHAPLRCDQCHPRSPESYLGATQACASCHADVHGPAMGDDCATCHSQEAFQPAARFEHARRFPLLGPHADVECARCHPRDETGPAGAAAAAAPLDFRRVTGTTCRECHATPHRAPLGDDCSSCHRADDAHFALGSPRFTAADHARTGFALAGPHAQVACTGCHAAGGDFAARYPGRAAQECASCHESPHGGQFGAREAACGSCHPGDSFHASTTTVKNHRPKLRDRHRELACEKCHAPPAAGAPARFVGTPGRCAQCHADPHAGQFAKEHPDCASCHDEKRFAPSRYDFAKEHVKLNGAHAALACAACHVTPPKATAVRFVGTPTKCASCHDDVHRGQFAAAAKLVKGGRDCATCHDETRFVPSRFDLARHDPKLGGAHLAVACSRCHVLDSKKTRRFVGTARDCKGCHEDPHRGQLTPKGVDCDRCHRSDEQWLPTSFDHETQSRFKLEGVHSKLGCAECHLVERTPEGRDLVHYKPLGTECRDCHATR